MKKTLIFTGLLALSMTASAAVTVTAIEQITFEGSASHPVLSPDGKSMLFSSENHRILSHIDLESGKVTTIDQAPGAGFEPMFSSDSRRIVYRTASTNDGLSVHDTRSYNIADGKQTKLAEFSRVSSNTIEFSGKESYACSNYRTISVVTNGIAREVSPLTDAHSYLWASLSPDGTRLLFCEPFQGVFVANIDGSNPVKITAKGDYPSWVDNTTVAYVVSHDDGYILLDSTAMVCDLTDMSTLKITNDETIVGEISAAAGIIVYSTLDGKLYKTSIKR